MRRCPRRSPSLPTDGPMTPNASIGPVTTQVIVASAVWNSPAIRWIDTARIVIVMLTENSPNNTVASTTHGERPAKSVRSPRPDIRSRLLDPRVKCPGRPHRFGSFDRNMSGQVTQIESAEDDVDRASPFDLLAGRRGRRHRRARGRPADVAGRETRALQHGDGSVD